MHERFGWLEMLLAAILVADVCVVCFTLDSTLLLLLLLLQANGTPGTWTHISTQQGMFAFTGLHPVQVDALTSRHHVRFFARVAILCGRVT